MLLLGKHVFVEYCVPVIKMHDDVPTKNVATKILSCI